MEEGQDAVRDTEVCCSNLLQTLCLFLVCSSSRRERERGRRDRDREAEVNNVSELLLKYDPASLWGFELVLSV